MLPEGAPVEVYGCLAGYSWCDVSSYGDRGWVSSRYISIFYDGPNYVYRPRYVVPSVSFSFDYWDRWYYDRPWYRTYRRPREERIYRPPVYRNEPPVYRNEPRVERRNDRGERIWRDPSERVERIERPRAERNRNLERYVDPDGFRNNANERNRRGGGGECGPNDPRCRNFLDGFDNGNARNR